MTETDFLCLTPLLIIAIAPVVIMLIVSIFRKYEIVFAFSLVSLVVAFLSLFPLASIMPHAINHLFVFDLYSLFFLGIIFFTAFLIILLSHDYFKHLKGFREEYFIILFTATLGASLLVVANHFLIFFLGFETLSISLYILIAFQKEKNIPLEAGVKYLILASFSSAFLLFGMGLIYTAFGKMGFPEIAGAILTQKASSPMVVTGFAMMLVGVGFKLALVPFHMWTPDVYQGAPAPVSGYIATVSKGGLMAVFIRFFFYVKGYSNQEFFFIISVIAVLSMFVGNILAIRQQNLKRLLGYSSIANMGYLLIILLVGTKQGAQAAIFYLISYFVTVVGAFGIISLVSTSTKEAERIEDYKGLFWKRPWLAIVLTLSLLSLAGIPITAGFIAKFYVIFEGVKSGLMLLVFAMIIGSVIGLYYYIRVIAALFSTGDEVDLPPTSIIGNVALAIITVGILVLGLYPGWLIEMITKLVAL